MKTLLIIICTMFCFGCSSKVVTLKPTGEKIVTTKTDASVFSDAQSKAWAGYYTVIRNPPVIATLTQPDGSVISINSQIPPPVPVIRQHQNQYIKPITGMLKTGIQIIGGGLVVREIVNSMQGTNITNSGGGTVTVDRSENVAVETNHAEESSVLNQASNNDESDNHIENADPVIVETERVIVLEPEVVILEPEVIVLEPEVVNPKVIIVE